MQLIKLRHLLLARLLACCCSDNYLLSVCLQPSCHCLSSNVVQMSRFLLDCFHLLVATCFCAVTAVLSGLFPLGQLDRHSLCPGFALLQSLLACWYFVLIFRSMPQAVLLRDGWICNHLTAITHHSFGNRSLACNTCAIQPGMPPLFTWHMELCETGK